MYILHINIKLCKTPSKMIKRTITKDGMSQGGRGREEPLQYGVQGPTVPYFHQKMVKTESEELKCNQSTHSLENGQTGG